MPKKNVFSIKDELIRKGREAVLAAVQVYNNPNITFKAETFITLAVIGWTYLCRVACVLLGRWADGKLSECYAI